MRRGVAASLPVTVAGLVMILGCQAGAGRWGGVPLIFDTDMGNDIDDALALAMIHGLADRGEVRLLAVTISKDESWSAPFVDAVNTFYGRPEVPVGVVRDGFTPEPSAYTRVVAEARANGRLLYPHDLLDGRHAPDAVGLMRRTLADWPADGEIVMVVVGPATNAARLLASPPDEASPLPGRELVARKVRFLSIMAGDFRPRGLAEFNVVSDLASAQTLWAGWPTPVIASGYEIGDAILYPGERLERECAGYRHHPVRDAYRAYMKMPYDRPCWDLTSVLVAVRPDAGYFDLSPPGWIRVDERGYTLFTPAPDGPHRYLMASPRQREKVLKAILDLVRPSGRAGS